jgi:uncharacterized cupin superfamily protein|tara:strand:- start:361 stop:816 length:456 start_codon:yes stop_codon:yes gene_type:complete
MKKIILTTAIGIFLSTSVLADHHEENTIVKPAKITKNDIAGNIYNHPDMVKSTNNGNTTLDVTTMLSSDGKFGTGMYRSGKVRFEITEPYGVDEFFYVLEGSITLISADGTVTKTNAGEAVSIPKEWTGIWDTDGYSKIWVIYSEDGSALK